MDSSSSIQKSNSQPSQFQIQDPSSSISTNQKQIQDLSYTKRQNIIRAVLDSYLRGCIVGNLIDCYIQKEGDLQEQIYKKIITGEIYSVPQSDKKEIFCDITWHYLFFAEIYTLLEYDSILSPEPLNVETYMKYLLVMIKTCNKQTRSQLENIFPNSITFSENDTPSGNQNKYIEVLQQWINNKQQFQNKQFLDKILRCQLDPKTHLKLTISKIVPILFIYSTNSLKIPVEKVSVYTKKFCQNEEQTALAFYFVFMNKLLKYYLKENNIQKAINRIKLKLKEKKKYLNSKISNIIQKFEKKIDKLKAIQKEQKFSNITESSQQLLIDEYSIKVITIKKNKPYTNLDQLLVDIIVLLIGFIGILDHDSIIIKMSKLVFFNSSIPALLLTFPVLAVRYPERYSETENRLAYKINSQECILNYLNPDPWFSTQVSNQIFTEFVNLYSEKFYRTSK